MYFSFKLEISNWPFTYYQMAAKIVISSLSKHAQSRSELSPKLVPLEENQMFNGLEKRRAPS
jgi:hypothetical protein